MRSVVFSRKGFHVKSVFLFFVWSTLCCVVFYNNWYQSRRFQLRSAAPGDSTLRSQRQFDRERQSCSIVQFDRADWFGIGSWDPIYKIGSISQSAAAPISNRQVPRKPCYSPSNLVGLIGSIGGGSWRPSARRCPGRVATRGLARSQHRDGVQSCTRSIHPVKSQGDKCCCYLTWRQD